MVYEITCKADLPAGARVTDSLALDHAQREKGRLKVKSEKGIEARLFLERGTVLEDGQILRATSGEYLRVSCRAEPVVTARGADWPAFSRACYHLGNRHVRLQIGERWLRFVPDPVLEELVSRLGLEIERHEAVFEPEPGAYRNGHGHAH